MSEPQRIRAFAAAVNAAARKTPRAIGGKVWIGDVWEEMDFPHRADFDRDLLAAMRMGLVELQRLDLFRPGMEDDQEASLVTHPMTGAQYHFVVLPRSNPARVRKNAGIIIDDDALGLYRSFNRLEPEDVVVEEDQSIPTHAYKMGKAVHVMYRSKKIDPETGKKPRGGAQNYIHEHDAGVHLYTTDEHEITIASERARCDVPARERGDHGNQTLVLLGECLGVAWTGSDGDDLEIAWDDPTIELYTTPTGRMLVVVDDKREILYLIWGGGLAVEERGIVG